MRGVVQGYAQDLQGNALANTTITLYQPDQLFTTKISVYYDAISGGNSYNQDTTPIVTNSSGFYRAYVDVGDVDIEYVADSLTQRLTNVPVYNGAELTQQAADAVNAAAAAAISESNAGVSESNTLLYRNTTLVYRDETLAARDVTITARDETITARDETITARDVTTAARDETITARDATLAARNVTATAKDTTLAARDEALAFRDAARIAAEASGDISFFDNYSQASSALGSLPENQVVEVFQDETNSNRRTRYRKEGGVLVFKFDFATLANVNIDGGTIANVAITGGTIDGIAVANLLDKTAFEEISGQWTFSRAAGGAFNVTNTSPSIFFRKTDAAIDSKHWDFFVRGTKVEFRALSDNQVIATNWLEVNRTGTTIDAVVFPNGSVAVTGALTAASYDGILAANLLDKTAPETVSGAWTYTAGVPITLRGTSPRIRWDDTLAGVDSGNWDIVAQGGGFEFRALNDSFGAPTTWLEVNRTGTTIDAVVFPNGNVGIRDASPLSGFTVIDPGVTGGYTYNSIGAAKVTALFLNNLSSASRGAIGAATTTFAENQLNGVTFLHPTSDVDSSLVRRAFFGTRQNSVSGTTFVDFEWASGSGSFTTHMKLNSAGNLGVGATEPQARLHVKDPTNYKGIFINGSVAPVVSFASSESITPAWKVGLSGNNAANFSISSGAANTDKLVINAAGNFGFGTADIENWGAAFVALQYGFSGAIWGSDSLPSNHISTNVYHDGGGFRYKSTDEAVDYEQSQAGTHIFRVAPSGTIDTAITWTDALTIANDGETKGIQFKAQGTTETRQFLLENNAGLMGLQLRPDAGLGRLYADSQPIDIATFAAQHVSITTNSIERLRVNAAGNFGFATSDIEAVGTNHTAMQLGSCGHLLFTTTGAGSVNLSDNAYWDGVWRRRIGGAPGVSQVVINNGEVRLRTAGGGAIDSEIVWNEALTVTSVGQVNVGGNRVLTVADEGSGNNLDADLLDGAHGNITHNDFTGNEYVRRHTSGYIFSNYFNMTADDIGAATPSRVPVETNSDGYLRWQTLANFSDKVSQSQIYTGSDVNETNFPVGHTIEFITNQSNAAAQNRNAAKTLYLAASFAHLYTDSTFNPGTQLAGTWRVRGYSGATGTSEWTWLAQRVA